MNKNHLLIMGALFISGIVVGAIGIQLFPCRCNDIAPMLADYQVSDTVEANKLFHIYYDHYKPEKDTFKGYLLEKDQAKALSNFLDKNPHLAGARIYMASDGHTPNLKIIVGVVKRNAEFIDDTKLIFKTTTLGKADPCPPICDGKSAITR
jgi:hypothetical protein